MHSRFALVVSILVSFAGQAVQTIYWNSPLQEAAWKGDAPLVEHLLEEAATDQVKAAEILKETEGGLNALHMAVVTGQHDVIRLLLRSPFYAFFLKTLDGSWIYRANAPAGRPSGRPWIR